MSDKKSLIVTEQREVPFYGDALLAVRADDGQIYVAVAQMCRALGLEERSQRRRIQNHTIIGEGYTRGDISTPPSADGRGGGRQKAGLLRVDLVPLWLAGIEAGKTAVDIRPKLERFQREAAKTLWQAFQENQLTVDPTYSDLLAQDSPEAQAYKMIQGMLHLARNQLLMRTQLQEHGERLERIEATLGQPGRAVTTEQASQLSQAVKAVAHAMGGHGKHYQSVYGELYRKEGITSYKLLPAQRFAAVMQWLTQWFRELTDGADVPF